jgi:hypothetical protein
VVDAFAAEMLLPINVIRVSCADGGDIRDVLLRLAATYRTSWGLALRQAEAAGAIDKDTIRVLRQRTPTHADFRDSLGWTPQPDLGSIMVPPLFAHSVMEAWRRHLITAPRAIELMHGQLKSESDLPTRPDPETAP